MRRLLITLLAAFVAVVAIIMVDQAVRTGISGIIYRLR